MLARDSYMSVQNPPSLSKGVLYFSIGSFFGLARVIVYSEYVGRLVAKEG